ncbi:D-alanyl-D-alanine carboxypeptidase [Lachnospiraceae bacterium KM106-2]|nr:D-alanyl-D-alanine carboxypeptidase [Lachnospiraceae bacterium KM106-2]
MKKIISLIIAVILCMNVISYDVLATDTTPSEGKEQTTEENNTSGEQSSGGDSMGITAKSAVLMEGSTGKIIYQKDKDMKLNPASITKIMTLLLIFEAIDGGKIKMGDKVSVSEHAASMGGSQVFLEPNETQTVDTMLKCISIASANDACVAMAEKVAGSEAEFVSRMNKKAKELGMNNTNFVNCCGLDANNHYTTANDVAIMSRELITKYPQISDYSTVWMDKFTHVTKKGETEFGLTNTNKLVRFYDGITGLKTGSTSKAKYCLSATAKRNGMNLIAVVMSAPEPKTRFAEAAKLLDYGFANCTLYADDFKNLKIDPAVVVGGVKESINGKPGDAFNYMCLNGEDTTKIQRKVKMKENLTAPVKINQEIGTISYYYEGKQIGKIPIVAAETIRQAKYGDSFIRCLNKFFIIH